MPVIFFSNLVAFDPLCFGFQLLLSNVMREYEELIAAASASRGQFNADE
jgi:hypothetical protein